MQNLTTYLNIFSINDGLMLSIAFVLILSLRIFKGHREKQKKDFLYMQSLQREMRALANASIGVGGRVLEIERQQRNKPVAVVATHKEVQQTQQPCASYNNVTAPFEDYNPSNQPYEQAIRMALTGASTKDIVNVCGLSESEAELVGVMHRLDKVS